MRTIGAPLLGIQQLNNRHPVSRVTVYDSLLRWTSLASGGGIDIADYLAYQGVQAAYTDADISGDVPYAWTVDSDAGLNYIYYDGSWHSGTFGGGEFMGRYSVRPSAFGNTLYYGSASTYSAIYLYKVTPGAGAGTLVNSNLTVGAISSWFKHAFAAVASDEVYHAWFGVTGANDPDATLHIEFVDGAGAPEACPYSIGVSDEYTGASLSWFDAVRLPDGTDVIVINVEAHGRPEVILRRNGVWGDHHAIVPVDIVDNYSYLRIGWLKVYNGVIYATGELGRKGSTGTHPQSMAVVLRSADGIHWSLDRWRYLGQTPLRSPLLLTDQYAYLFRLPSLYRAPLTPVFGLQDASAASDVNVYFPITTDILQWNAGLMGDREQGQLSLLLSDGERQYSTASDPTYIKPGFLLKLEAGYASGASDLLTEVGWYGVDAVSPTVADGVRALTVQGREWSMRALADNAFDQDWEWLSTIRLFDDCSVSDHLYSISGSTVRLAQQPSGLQSELVTAAPADPGGNLVVIDERDKTVLVSTVPFEAREGFAAVAFTVDGSDAYLTTTNCYFELRLGINEYGLGYDSATRQVGVGAGPAIIADAHTYLTAFLDVRTKQLVFLRAEPSAGSDYDEDWEELATHDLSAYIEDIWVDGYLGSQLYEVWLEVVGSTIHYGINISQTGHPWPAGSFNGYIVKSTVEASPYDPDTITALEWDYADVLRQGEDRLGAVVGTTNPYVRLALHANDDEVMLDGHHGRSLLEYNNGESIVDSEANEGHQPYYVETGEYNWEDFRKHGLPERSGFVYLEGAANNRELLHGEVEIDSSTVPASMRGDYVTGLWEVLAVDSDPNHVYISLDPSACYPPGEDSSYWLTNLGATNPDDITWSGFWFMDGDLEGRFLLAQGVESDASNVKFDLLVNDADEAALPTVGDHVVYGPGVNMPFHYPSTRKYVGTSRVYWNPGDHGVHLRSFVGHNRARQISVQWTLDDVVSKAGVLSTTGGQNAKEYKLDTTVDADGEHVLLATAKDFDLRLALSAVIASGNTLRLSFGRRSGGDASDDQGWAQLASSGGDFEISVGSRYSDVEITHFTRNCPWLATAKNIRITKDAEFVSVWAEESLALSFPLRKRWTDVSYEDSITTTWGEVVLDFTQGGTTVTAREEQLWSPIEAVIGNQGSNAIALLSSVIRDARIKVLPGVGLGLVRTSVFDSRDDAGTLPDILFSDQQTLTDGLPSHVRVTGAEIGEYFDHATMAEYGVVFTPRTVESLDEEEAYLEARRAVWDFLGNNYGRRQEAAAQLQLQPEDELSIDLTTLDGQTIEEDCIISSIALTFGEAQLEMLLTLRRKYGT